ncbi:sigma-54-dependent transcriptional regulator [Niabella aquatica]
MMSLKNISILAVDDDPDMLIALRLLLKPFVKTITTEKNPEQLRSLLTEGDYDLLILDMNFTSSLHTGNEGMYWLRKAKALKPNLQVIMITAYADVDLAVRSLKEGAADFIVKPWHNEKLIEAIEEIWSRKGNNLQKKSDTGKQNDGLDNFIGHSPAIREVLYKVKKIAPTEANILILGENGTGKDMIAHTIHQQSLRSKGPFVKVDVGALTPGLFESELFGHRKGAFTDAREDRPGRFEMASGGTLFLDEIGNISLPQQASLLSVLQNRVVHRLGSNEGRLVDIRLICATNLPMQELASENRFRKDLIYRINTVEIILPPLRERKEDILPLAAHFCKVYCGKYLKSLLPVGRQAKEKLLQYHYPGNVRELQYAIERAVIMCERDTLQDDDIIFSPIEKHNTMNEPQDTTNLELLEKSTIIRVIEKYDGNITRAAKELGLTRTALYRRLNKYDI